MKSPFKIVGKYVGKVHNSKAVKAVDRFLEKPRRRRPVAIAASISIKLAGGAGIAGVFVGNGETLVQKLGDAVTAIPKGIVSSIDHYIHAPEYARKTDAAFQYLRERGPEVAEELGRSGRLLQAGATEVKRGWEIFREARDYLWPGGDKPFDPISAYHSLGDGVRTMEAAATNINAGKDQFTETAGPAIEALKQVDMNPFFEALHNFADNLATDEIGYTLGVAAASLVTASAMAMYLGSYWGRRGRPGYFARRIQRRGIKDFQNRYIEHPEEIAGPEGIQAYEGHLLRNPEKLEALVERAGLGKEK
ncbi:hypothetical protein J4422_01920 [Candidatus Pacearchaeota archaeon]|nr:hypothetical protein [Candidatus Pacearchaeota archaeon]